MIVDFEGEWEYTFTISITPQSGTFSNCKPDGQDQEAKFETQGGQISFNHEDYSKPAKQSKAWLWVLIIAVVIIVVAVGVYCTFFKSSDSGGFGKI